MLRVAVTYHPVPPRRLKWLGKVIRREEDFLVRQFILAEADNHGNKVRGSILNDIPHIENARDLVTMAEDLEGWSEIMDNNYLIVNSKLVRDT